MTLKIGVCGTAFWAEHVHLPGLAATDGIELVGLWGRSPEPAARLADKTGVTAFPSFEALLDTVDALSFAVPPEVQSRLAPLAIARGRHVILEKPLGDSIDSALAIRRAITAAGVTGLCFLTRMFVPEIAAFLDRARALDPREGRAEFRSNALGAGPYAASPWRQAQYGALHDAAPHGMSVLVSALGPVREVAGRTEPDDAFTLSFRHEGGQSSTLLLNLRDASVQLAESYQFRNGSSVDLPGLSYDRKATFARAAATLRDTVAGRPDAGDTQLDLALHLVCVAAAAQQSLESGGDFLPVATPQP